VHSEDRKGVSVKFNFQKKISLKLRQKKREQRGKESIK
jgi:hypothetical protein